MRFARLVKSQTKTQKNEGVSKRLISFLTIVSKMKLRKLKAVLIKIQDKTFQNEKDQKMEEPILQKCTVYH